MSAGRYDEAEAELLRAVEVSPAHPQPHLLLSQLYFRAGKEDLAAKEKQLSLRLRKENRETMEAPQGRPFIE
jgi:Tfp pilus assembly protein PilF